MLLYFVRHCESVWNAEGRVQGHSDVRLSDLGRRQSEAVAEALVSRPIETVWSSPLRRAMETAEPIARRLGLPVQIDPRLKEINAGVFQDKRGADLVVLYPGAYERWLSGDADFRIPGGESRRELAERARAAVDSIRATGREQVAIIAHGGVIVSAVKSLLGVPLSEPPLAVANGSITTIVWPDNGPVRVLALDQVGHLAAVGQGTRGDLPI